LTDNLSNTDGRECVTKYESLILEIKNIWKFNNVSIFLLVIREEGAVTRKFFKKIEKVHFTENVLRVGQKSVLHTCHIGRKFLGHAP